MAGDNVQVFTDASFEPEVLKSEQPVLVDFWASWCGPCKMIAPLVEELAEELQGKLKVGKLNVDENGKTPADFGVMSIPTLLLFKDGQLVDRLVGFQPREHLERLVQKVF